MVCYIDDYAVHMLVCNLFFTTAELTDTDISLHSSIKIYTFHFVESIKCVTGALTHGWHWST